MPTTTSPPYGPGTALTGCAGWTIARESAAFFPDEGSHLERYARVFGAVEINSSFYRPHQPQTYARWADSVPDAFRFSVKAPRTMTHQLRLRGVGDKLARFAAEAQALGPKLGCVLVQLPPSLTFQPSVADRFFAQMRATFGCMLACEARHPSWFGDDAGHVLQAHAVTRVQADPPTGQKGPYRPTTPTSYTRLHGSPRMYYSAYSDIFVQHLATQLAKDAQAGHPHWVIFDNTAEGAALVNALALRGATPVQPMVQTAQV